MILFNVYQKGGWVNPLWGWEPLEINLFSWLHSLNADMDFIYVGF